MATSTILAADNTAATSSDFTVNAGQLVTLSLFSAASLPTNIGFPVYLVGVSGEVYLGQLSAGDASRSIATPGTYRVKRPALSASNSVGIMVVS